MQVKTRTVPPPVANQLGLVRGGIVEDQVHFQVIGYVGVEGVQEGAELLAAVALLAGANHRARLHVERGKEVQRAVALVVVGVPLGLAGALLREWLTRDHLSVIAAVNRQGRFYSQVRERAFDAVTVVEFLRQLLRQVPGKLLVI